MGRPQNKRDYHGPALAVHVLFSFSCWHRSRACCRKPGSRWNCDTTVVSISTLLASPSRHPQLPLVLEGILVTGFLGGAICAYVRIGELGSQPEIISLLLGAMTWGGLYLRHPRIRPLRRSG